MRLSDKQRSALSSASGEVAQLLATWARSLPFKQQQDIVRAFEGGARFGAQFVCDDKGGEWHLGVVARDDTFVQMGTINMPAIGSLQ